MLLLVSTVLIVALVAVWSASILMTYVYGQEPQSLEEESSLPNVALVASIIAVLFFINSSVFANVSAEQGLSSLEIASRLFNAGTTRICSFLLFIICIEICFQWALHIANIKLAQALIPIRMLLTFSLYFFVATRLFLGF